MLKAEVGGFGAGAFRILGCSGGWGRIWDPCVESRSGTSVSRSAV